MNPTILSNVVDVDVIDVSREIDRLIEDGKQAGHADGEQRYATSSEGLALRAERSLHTRSQRLIEKVCLYFDLDLSRTQLEVREALAQYQRAVAQLPEAVRKAKRVFDDHLARYEVPLLEVARQAEAEQRNRRAQELKAGVAFRTEGSGQFPLMIAVLFVAVTIEATLSTTLLADNHPGGYLGAAGLAATLAILNLAFAFNSGRLLRAMFDRETIGWCIAAVGVSIAVLSVLMSFHLLVAKLRELSLIAESFQAALFQAVTATFAHLPTEFSSLLIGLLGLGCGIAGVVAGWQRADAARIEREAQIARTAEAALLRFQELRSEYESPQDVVTQASAVLDAIDTEVNAARKTLDAAINAWQNDVIQLASIDQSIANGYRAAVHAYRAHVAAVQSRPDAVRENQPPIGSPEVPRMSNDSTILEPARAALAATEWTRSLESARQEVDRAAKLLSQRIAERLTALEATVYSDFYRPADNHRPRPPSAQFVAVAEMRRAEA